MKKIGAGLILFLLILSLSCTHRLTDFTMISSKNIELSKMSQYTRGSSRITGEDTSFIIFIFPIGQANPKKALDRAIESIPGCVALLDGVLSSTVFMLPPFFATFQYNVEGTCLIDPEVNKKILLRGDSQINRRNYVTYYDRVGVKKISNVSDQEFSMIQSALNHNDINGIKVILPDIGT
jgi:hypothetical protein